MKEWESEKVGAWERESVAHAPQAITSSRPHALTLSRSPVLTLSRPYGAAIATGVLTAACFLRSFSLGKSW